MTNRPETFHKILEYLLVARSCALMMANAQTATGRNEYLKRLAEQLKNAMALLDKLEGESEPSPHSAPTTPP